MEEKMRIEPIGDSFANEVHDLPLWKTIGVVEADAIRDSFRRSGVLVFRRQSLSEEELLGFGKMVGMPDLYAEAGWLSDVPEVILLSNLRDQEGAILGGLANRALTWHTDQSYYAKPVTGCFLYAVELPAEGGETSWSSLYRAYDTLPSALRKAVNGAIGTFSFAARMAGGSSPGKADNHSTLTRIPSQASTECHRTKLMICSTDCSTTLSNRRTSTITIGDRATWYFGTMRLYCTSARAFPSPADG